MNLIFENKKVKKHMESIIGRTGLLRFSPLPCANPMLCYVSYRNCQCEVN